MEIKIKLNNMKYRYDVYQMFNIYFPLDEIKFLDDGDYIVNILDGKIEFKYGEYYNESKILENIKEDIKKLVFSSLKELTKEEYPWGILVGIRPSKIALKYLEEGKTEEEIIVAQPIQSGVSKNGNNWQRQDFVLEIPGQYPKKVAFSVMNSNIQNFGLAVGQDVDIEIDINANEWQGKWFNSITCWKATLRNPGQPTAAQQPQTYYQGASSTAAPVQTAIPQPPVDFGEQKDDLPF